jgi:hypothetical protein
VRLGAVCLGLLLALSACSARHREAASAATVASALASQPALRACDTRTFNAGGADVTVTSNLDGTLGGIRMQDADPVLRNQIVAAVTQRFGSLRRDKRVQTRTGKWGLTVLIDACGRPLDLSGSTKPQSP